MCIARGAGLGVPMREMCEDGDVHWEVHLLVCPWLGVFTREESCRCMQLMHLSMLTPVHLHKQL